MKVITFKIDDELLEALNAEARRLGVSRSYIIRRAIILYLSRERPRIF